MTVHQSEWGFEEIATPEIVENIIMDIGASGGGMIPDLELPPLDLYDDGDTDIGGDDDDANAAKKFLVSSSFFDNSGQFNPSRLLTLSVTTIRTTLNTRTYVKLHPHIRTQSGAH